MKPIPSILFDDALLARLYDEGCTTEEILIGLTGEPGPWQWSVYA